MKLYYRAIDSDGKPVSGLIDGKDVHGVAAYLRNHHLTPIKIIEANNKGFMGRLSFARRPKLQDRIFFTRQLASMLTSGLTLMQSLEIVKNQTPNPSMSVVIQEIMKGVEGGDVFSTTLQKHPEIFPPIYVALIKSSESSGLLDKVLLRLAENLEKQDKLQKTIRSALMYPFIVIIVMILVVIVMMLFVLPQLTELYKNINITLPLSTKIILAISDFFGKIWYLGIIVIAVCVYLFRRWYRDEVGRKIIDGLVLRVPIFGKLIKNTMLAEFTRTLGLLIGAGTLVVDSLLKSSEVVGNVLYKEAIILVSKRVEKGITMGDAMNATTLFPPMVVEMVKIGEQTGKLDESLLRSSEYFEREVDQLVKNLTTLMEPIIIVFLAVGVGFLIFSIITPIYGLISSIQ
jgi:type IV pilus assembly protein PilC